MEANRLSPHPKSVGFGVARPQIYDRLSAEDVLGALARMHLIRRFEEAAEDSYIRGKSYGTMHLSIGQEATAVGVCAPLSDATTSPRPIAATATASPRARSSKRMFAEFLGRETGYCRGRGGSMHIADPAKGNLGANGIVGGGLPIAVGAALSAKRLRTGAVAVAFFGDGANNEGAFHESLNLASIWKLPVVFVCENNLYGMSVSTRARPRSTDVADRAPRLCDARRHRRRQRFRRRRRGSVRRDRSGARRRGPTLIEAQDLSHPRPFALRPQPLSHARRRSRPGARATRSRCSKRNCWRSA